MYKNKTAHASAGTKIGKIGVPYCRLRVGQIMKRERNGYNNNQLKNRR
jgi:hypothetical protein